MEDFINRVIKDNLYQEKKLRRLELTEKEYDDFESLLEYFNNVCNISMDECVKSYLTLNDMVYKETIYFLRNGHYRFSKFEDTKRYVYDNDDVMRYYMIGLHISGYIWLNHLKMIRYFDNNRNLFTGKRYLEIGPGYGQYLIRSIQNLSFEEFNACDISQTSVDGCNAYLHYRKVDNMCHVELLDFFQYPEEESFDLIVMCEVLEHAEDPLSMLEKIQRLLSDNGKAFITTVINAPMPDHIFLFPTVDSVLDLAHIGGGHVIDYMLATDGEVPLEQAIKQKRSITIAMILGKEITNE